MAEASSATVSTPPEVDGSRRIELTYSVEIPGIPASSGPVDVWIPIPRSDDAQTVEDQRFESSIEGRVKDVGDRHGNRVWHARVETPDGSPIRVTSTTIVTRRVLRSQGIEAGRNYSLEELTEGAPYLQADSRVPISGDPVDAMSADIAPGETDPTIVAKAIFDFVVDTMEYKKTGTGWGNGDTYWACSERYGNCTDFHALVNSLTRNRGIPSRFSIGFLVPQDRASGKIAGYHCWARVLLPGEGWVGLDASEAKKHLERREELFGSLPADRIRFTTGRDLEIGQASGPLNYFIDPHIEVAGKQWKEFTRTVTFRDL
jgi:transglutaminase-like putative cysteine protease